MIDKESGSSLIWFVNLLALTVLLLLTLVSSLHQYLFARKLHDYTEQVALAGKTWTNQGLSFLEIQTRIDELPQFPQDLSVQNFSYQDGRTFEAELCSKWVSPLPLVEIETEVCEKAKAR